MSPHCESLLKGTNFDLVGLSSEVVRCFSPQVWIAFCIKIADAGRSTALLSILHFKY